MSGRSAPTRAMGIGWYRRESYDATRDLMADAAILPETFEKFLYRALKAEEQSKRAGIAMIRVHLDTDEFPAFCRERGLNLDAKGRMEYAAWVACQMVEAKNAGQA